MTDAQPAGARPEGERVVIKKYANRRLYNTASSSYVTLEHLSEMVKQGVDFVVYDAKTSEDITRSVLTQIIFEEENRGQQNLLPIQFLRQLIRFYGDSMQAFVPSYLELSLNSFTQQQEQMRQQFGGAFAQPRAMGYFDDQVRQNMQLFDRAMKMFSPFNYAQNGGVPGATPTAAPAGAAGPAPAQASIERTTEPQADPEGIADLRKQVEEMRRQLEKLSSRE